MEIWTDAAARIGLLRVPATAERVLHELCHTLVEGRDGLAEAERACEGWREDSAMRIQYVLAGRHGLRDAMTPVGGWQLSGDVLADRTARVVRGAVLGLRRSDREPWAPVLHEALAATAAALGISPRPRHPTGLALGDATGTCVTCAWRIARGTAGVCQQAEDRVEDAWPACEDYEPALDCQDCGGCCREAFDVVAITDDDPAIQRIPQLVVISDGRYELARAGDRCAALEGGNGAKYACTVYADRPITCRQFEAGSPPCLGARRRLALSR